MENIISFPDLSLSFTIDRVAFSIFGHDVYWYGAIIAFGFLLAMFYALSRCKSFGITEEKFSDALLLATPIAIICARLYYVIFEWDNYSGDLLAIIAIWEGGLAIYGGIIGAVITTIVYCKINKIRVGNMLDIAALGFLIGQCIGRWGNFINAEAFGSVTDLPVRMVINDATVGVHPTFLYESFWNLIGFILLHFYSKYRKFAGEVFFLYIAWYGLGRSIIEGLRTDSLYIGFLRVSQILGILSAVFAIGMIVFLRHKKKTSLPYDFSLEEHPPAVLDMQDVKAEPFEFPLDKTDD